MRRETFANRIHMLVHGVPTHPHTLGDLVDRLPIRQGIADLLRCWREMRTGNREILQQADMPSGVDSVRRVDHFAGNVLAARDAVCVSQSGSEDASQLSIDDRSDEETESSTGDHDDRALGRMLGHLGRASAQRRSRVHFQAILEQGSNALERDPIRARIIRIQRQSVRRADTESCLDGARSDSP